MFGERQAGFGSGWLIGVVLLLLIQLTVWQLAAAIRGCGCQLEGRYAARESLRLVLRAADNSWAQPKAEAQRMSKLSAVPISS